jgi:hypothetical protein
VSGMSTMGVFFSGFDGGEELSRANESSTNVASTPSASESTRCGGDGSELLNGIYEEHIFVRGGDIPREAMLMRHAKRD